MRPTPRLPSRTVFRGVLLCRSPLPEFTNHKSPRLRARMISGGRFTPLMRARLLDAGAASPHSFCAAGRRTCTSPLRRRGWVPAASWVAACALGDVVPEGASGSYCRSCRITQRQGRVSCNQNMSLEKEVAETQLSLQPLIDRPQLKDKVRA